MKLSQKIILFAILSVTFFAIGFVSGKQIESKNISAQTKVLKRYSDVDLTPMWKAWELLDEKFVPATSTKKLTKEDHIWGIVEGLTSSYGDPHTVFFPPQKSKSFEQEISGSFGGIGVEIGIREGILTVIAPLKGTPGDKAGLLPGDLIVEVDGNSTRNMTIDDAVEVIRGEIGTEVVLTIAREGENEFLSVPIIRDKIEIPTLDSELRDDGIFVISLYNFGGTAVTETRKALRNFLESESDKLILDLRGNPGGYLEASVDIASWFLPIGKTVVTEDYGDKKEKVVHRSKGYNIIDDKYKVAILVNGGSASASEILAGALKEHGKAVLIGTQTYGKGSVQELLDVTDDTTIKITIARWLTPNGISISHNGLKPDLEIKMTRKDIENDTDPQLDAAVNYLLTGELVKQETATSTKTVEENEKIE